MRATGRIVQIDTDTACAWLDRAAVQCRLVMLYLWRNLAVAQWQLDELWSFVHTKEQHREAATLFCTTYGDAWVWIAFAPVWRLVLAFVVGKRTQQRANLLLERGVHLSDATTPFFTRDQLAQYRTALLHVYGPWHQPARNGSRGCYPKPRRSAPADLLYAQVVKQPERGELIAVSTKVVFGEAAAIQARLAASPTSTPITTSFVERDNLTRRQQYRRLRRKTNGFSKEVVWLEKQLWLSLAYSHLVLPHASLRRELPSPEPSRAGGSERRWCPVTPAMAAGITDHVWTTTALLSDRVPVAFRAQLPDVERLFLPFESVHQGN